MEQDNPDSAAKAMQGGDAAGGQPRTWWWAEASIWTERMVSALGNGVKGGKWFSLADKAIRPTTLEIAWRKVERNKGAAGVDGQSVERFAAVAGRYLDRVHEDLKDGGHPPSPGQPGSISTKGGENPPPREPPNKGRLAHKALEITLEPGFLS